MRWSRSRLVGYDNRRFSVYETDTHVVTDDDVRPTAVSEKDWLPWALYKRVGGGRLELVGRFETARIAMSEAGPP